MLKATSKISNPKLTLDAAEWKGCQGGGRGGATERRAGRGAGLAAQSGNANVAAHAKAKGAEMAKRLTLALE